MQTDDNEARVFGNGFERCPRTNRPYERGHGSLSKERQTENFVRKAAYFADMPTPGERCLQTGREYDCSSGVPMKSAQSEQFLRQSRRRNGKPTLRRSPPCQRKVAHSGHGSRRHFVCEHLRHHGGVQAQRRPLHGGRCGDVRRRQRRTASARTRCLDLALGPDSTEIDGRRIDCWLPSAGSIPLRNHHCDRRLLQRGWSADRVMSKAVAREHVADLGPAMAALTEKQRAFVLACSMHRKAMAC